MTSLGAIAVFTRRRFLECAALLPVLTCVFRKPLLAAPSTRKPPYLALAQYILPGADPFEGERIASECHAALVEAFATGRLPLGTSARGSSPLPKAYRAIAPDLDEAVFRTAGVIGSTL